MKSQFNQRWFFDQNYRKLAKSELIAGIDEAGRGAMAGPLVVAAIVLPKDYQNPLIRDSKKLSFLQRQQIYQELLDVALSYSIEIVDVAVVETLNPKQATIQGMLQTLTKLNPKPALGLVDGEKIFHPQIPTIQLIKGDDLSLSIGAASILAKVTRDQILVELDQKYPGYDLKKNKGYCTLKHQEQLFALGISAIHRKTYAPVKRVLKKKIET